MQSSYTYTLYRKLSNMKFLKIQDVAASVLITGIVFVFAC